MVAHVRHMSWRRFVPSTDDISGPYRQMTNLFLAMNIATYIATKYDRGMVASMALLPYLVAKGETYRLLTCGFLHTDFLHLLANMLAMHWLGPGVEGASGRGRFALVYLASILAGSVMQYTYGSFNVSAWGASGGVSGLFAAYVVYRLRNRNYTGWGQADMSWIAQVVGLNLLIGMASGGSIGHWAHLGGALGGAAAMWLIGPRYVWQNGSVVDRPLLPWFGPRR